MARAPNYLLPTYVIMNSLYLVNSSSSSSSSSNGIPFINWDKAPG